MQHFWREVSSGRRKLVPTRGLHNAVASVPESEHRTAAQKNIQVDLMLGQIANYCVVISHNSNEEIYISCSNLAKDQEPRFLSTSAHFLDLISITLQAEKRHMRIIV